MLLIVSALIKTLALWVIFLVVVRKILGRPIAGLTSAVKEINLAHLKPLQVQSKTPRRNELHILEDAFNRMILKLQYDAEEIKSMVDQLQTLNTSLEKKVEGRTKELNSKFLELAKSNEKLETLNSEKNHFLHIAAHDLKSPLANLGTLATMVLQQLPEEKTEATEYLELIQKSSFDMSQLVGNLLDIDRIEAQVDAVELSKVDIVSVVHSTLRHFASQAKQREITYEMETLEEEMLAMSEPQWILQAVTNLISNAFKFSPDQSHIHLNLTHQNDKFLFAVSDQGPGISSKDRIKLFTKFGRLNASPRNNEKSTGLGLHSVKLMMLRMGGDVYLDEDYQNGARFILELQSA